LSPTTSGAIVIDSPRSISPSFVFQISLPLFASTATVCTSRVLKKTRPSL
jgi:hypothetical protein